MLPFSTMAAALILSFLACRTKDAKKAPHFRKGTSSSAGLKIRVYSVARRPIEYQNTRGRGLLASIDQQNKYFIGPKRRS
jgi:hypothetical protein